MLQWPRVPQAEAMALSDKEVRNRQAAVGTAVVYKRLFCITGLPTSLILSFPFSAFPELLDSTNTQLWLLKLSLEVVIWFILPVFIVEILLKWIASFSLYWKNPWNIFDFVITLLVRTMAGHWLAGCGVSLGEWKQENRETQAQTA